MIELIIKEKEMELLEKKGATQIIKTASIYDILFYQTDKGYYIPKENQQGLLNTYGKSIKKLVQLLDYTDKYGTKQSDNSLKEEK